MATAKLVEPTPPPKTVALEMSPEEARTLRQVLRTVGGDPLGPWRIIKQIDMALRETGIGHTEHPRQLDSQGYTHSFDFKHCT